MGKKSFMVKLVEFWNKHKHQIVNLFKKYALKRLQKK